MNTSDARRNLILQRREQQTVSVFKESDNPKPVNSKKVDSLHMHTQIQTLNTIKAHNVQYMYIWPILWKVTLQIQVACGAINLIGF